MNEMRTGKPRTPDRIEYEIDRAARILGGYAAIGELVGKTESLVRRWADPDEDASNIQARFCQIIDLACMAKTNEAPFRDFFDRASRGTRNFLKTKDLVSEAIDVDAAATDLLVHAHECLADGKLTAHERQTIQQKIDHARAQLNEVEAALGQQLRAV